MVQGGIETEVKIQVAGLANIEQKLRQLGFDVAVARLFEENTLYDRPERSLLAAGRLLRLRRAGDRAVITWKGPGDSAIHKSRPELETAVGSYEVMHQILAQLGFAPTFHYEKYRTEFDNGREQGTATLDETPIGNFLELEGSGEWIDRTAEQLGFSQADYLLDSYAKLYLKHCDSAGVRPSNMVFQPGT